MYWYCLVLFGLITPKIILAMVKGVPGANKCISTPAVKNNFE
ncbi:MAG: hypothetical protein P8X42_09920 [Calditrichaceae bacterium]